MLVPFGKKKQINIKLQSNVRKKFNSLLKYIFWSVGNSKLFNLFYKNTEKVNAFAVIN